MGLPIAKRKGAAGLLPVGAPWHGPRNAPEMTTVCSLPSRPTCSPEGDGTAQDISGPIVTPLSERDTIVSSEPSEAGSVDVPADRPSQYSLFVFRWWFSTSIGSG